ncbi:MAG: N-acetylmuramoyl-L-alanine amidase [Pelagibacteraceae bacterium]
MKLIRLNSPNFSKKNRNNSAIKYIIIHYTGMQSRRASINRLLSLRHKVSCHYLIDRKGIIIQMVNDKNVAWHSGKSRWKKIKNLNESSIGVELVNKGHRLGYEKFPKNQIKSLEILCKKLIKKYRINNKHILGHSDIAPLRKKDPGEKFPWYKLSKKKIGYWYPQIKKTSIKFDKKKMRNIFFKNLFKIGYRYFSKTKSYKSDKIIIKAFKMRYFPKKIDGIIDEKTLKISEFLAKSS